MSKLIIPGKQALRGNLKVSGSKNAAVAVLAATLVSGKLVRIDNLPDITDVRTLLEILQYMGASVRRRGRNTVEICTAQIRDGHAPPYELVKKLRASSYFMGSLLARHGEAEVPIPGGCELGPRPIDQHIKGFTALGAESEVEHGLVKLKAPRLHGAHIYMDVISVGATINLMLAASTAEGRTVLENVAKEPEVVDVANFMNATGASIRGAGTDIIRVDGVNRFQNAAHCIIPDRIEAGTFLLGAAATGGELCLREVIPQHLDAAVAKLKEAGIDVYISEDTIWVKGSVDSSPVDIRTFPYPGFPTDLQPLAMVLLTGATGTSVITENIFEGRFKHVDELKRMGAHIKVEGRMAVVEGGEKLSGAPVKATDLRAGAALLIAGMIAEGETVLSGVEHVYRGYEKLEEKLAQMGIRFKWSRDTGKKEVKGLGNK